MKQMDVYIPTKYNNGCSYQIGISEIYILAPIDFFWDNQSTILGAKKI